MARVLTIGGLAKVSGVNLETIRSRVGGGALDCSHASLRPPLKLDVQFSRIQLSRSRSSASGNGRYHPDQVDKPVLAVELAA